MTKPQGGKFFISRIFSFETENKKESPCNPKAFSLNWQTHISVSREGFLSSKSGFFCFQFLSMLLWRTKVVSCWENNNILNWWTLIWNHFAFGSSAKVPPSLRSNLDLIYFALPCFFCLLRIVPWKCNLGIIHLKFFEFSNFQKFGRPLFEFSKIFEKPSSNFKF